MSLLKENRDKIFESLRNTFGTAVKFDCDANGRPYYETGIGTFIPDHSKFRAKCNEIASKAIGRSITVF